MEAMQRIKAAMEYERRARAKAAGDDRAAVNAAVAPTFGLVEDHIAFKFVGPLMIMLEAKTEFGQEVLDSLQSEVRYNGQY